MRGAGIAGRLGCKLWVPLVLPVARDGERDIFIKVTDVAVFYANPRLLIACLRAEYFAVDVAEMDAPCETRTGNAGERARNTSWWSVSQQ